MSVVQTQDPVIISLTENAVARLKAMVAEKEHAVMLRVYVTGGGCSGFQYGFRFEDDAAEDDTCVQSDGATLLIDPLSYQYLLGSRVDYVENLQGARFVVDNPLAATTCGCGSSFSI